MFNITNFWKNHVIDNVLDELPSTDDYNIPDIIDKKTEDLLNQKAFDELSDPWPQPPEQDIEPVKTYEEYHKVMVSQLVRKDLLKLKSGIVFMAERINLPPMDTEEWTSILYLVALKKVHGQ